MSFACPNCGGRELLIYTRRPVALVVIGKPPSEDGFDQGYEVTEENEGEDEMDGDDSVECIACEYSSDLRSAQHASLHPHDWRNGEEPDDVLLPELL